MPPPSKKATSPSQVCSIKNPIYITSFSSTPCCSNSEHWTQNCIQSGNIHSIILVVYVDWYSAQNFPFFRFLHKLDKNFKLLPLFPRKLVRNHFHTGTNGLHTVKLNCNFELYLGEQDWERLVSGSRDLTLFTT